MFSPNIFDYHTLISGLKDVNESLSDSCSSHWSSELLKRSSEHHMTFWKSARTQQQALIHSILCQRLSSEKAGDVTPLDHQIARHRGTTSSYEKLAHWLKLFKKHQSLTPEEWVIELTYKKSFLLQKLIYCKDTQAAEMKFLKKVIKLCGEMRAIVKEFDCTLKKRSREQTEAEFNLCSY